ncbi:hypothetical protein HanHA300_Chr04g0140961 [Helianthus annuus]|nr:hypothetical protein HanHA300_Chr04g0140961 [Helianthus annuus]KAJ0597376.1 hypothetical protein HanHA89_Chr04g0153921 [Helianthus annuus]KAJ0758037.1 hypothetical protein HanLR1_Chr04g0145771 [Helianthus annuus]
MSDETLLKTNIESGTSESLYPTMVESPDLRWSFIRKVYSIVAIQLLFTAGVGAAVVSYHPFVTFMTTTILGIACYVFIILSTCITLWPLYYYSQRHPVNYVLLGIFTLGFSFAVGMSCAFTSVRVVLIAFILTSVVVVSESHIIHILGGKKSYEFWAFFLCGLIVVLIVAPFIQVQTFLLCLSLEISYPH